MNQFSGFESGVESYDSNNFIFPPSKLFPRSSGCEHLTDVRATTELDSDGMNVKRAWETVIGDPLGFSSSQW